MRAVVSLRALVSLLAVVSLLAISLGACGLGPPADEGGGGANLPTAGIGPYGKLEIDFDTPIDEPIVLADSQADLLEPAILPRDDGGYRFYVERRRGGEPGEIWGAETPALTELPDVPLHPVLVATMPWEAGDVRAPSLAIGDDGTIFLAYEAGDPAAIGIATSSDDGATFVARAAPVIAGGRKPSLTISGQGATIFYERPGVRGIVVALSNDNAASFQPTGSPVLSVGSGEDFDRGFVERPSAIIRVSAAGRERIDLFYQGRTGVVDNGDAESAIGHAGGFSLDALVRAPPVGEPVLAPGAPFEGSPAVLIEPTRGLMLYVDRTGSRARIGAATSP